MRLRSITVKDFKKFQGVHCVDSIGDGLNLLARDNETGKTTFMSALSAVIFDRHRSTAERVLAYRNKVTGNIPEISCRFEIDGALWEVWKRFAASAASKARLTGPGGEIYEGDRAEEKLQELLGFEQKGRGESLLGVWGALWVQQGQSFGLPDLDERARRTIHGCIETQVGVVTGGERGRRIPAAVRKAKAALLTTATAKPTGAYQAALAAEKELTAQLSRLTAERDEAAVWLARLAELDRELAGSRREDEAKALRDDLAKARAELSAAQQRRAAIEAARERAKSLELTAKGLADQLRSRETLRRKAAELDGEIEDLDRKRVEAVEAKTQAEAAAGAAQQARARAREHRRLAEEARSRASAMRRLANEAAQLERFEVLLKDATAHAETHASLKGQIEAIRATDERLQAAEAADQAVAKAEAALTAAATTVDIAVEDPVKEAITVGGSPVREANRSISVTEELQIGIAGVGSITVRPAVRGGDDLRQRLLKAQEDLRAALAACGVSAVAEARAANARRRQLERQASDAQAGLTAVLRSAGGKITTLEQLQTATTALRAKLKTEQEALGLASLPDRATAEDAEATAEEASRAAESAMSETEMAAEIATETLGRAASALSDLEARLEDRRRQRAALEAEIAAALEVESDEALTVRFKNAQSDHAAAKLELSNLEDQDDGIEGTQARVMRLEKAVEEYDRETREMEREAAGLRGQLGQRRGVEERIEAMRSELELATAQAARLREEAEVLTLLDEVLSEAERQAKERYVAPIRDRIMRYLPGLLPDASIEVSEDLGLSGLGRGGLVEDFDDLSHGTREQVAVLSRIAFAELLRDQGRPATVIMDDALVFSDESRIERMFDLLTRAAQNLQILVLTCHPSLWRRLGAARLDIRPVLDG